MHRERGAENAKNLRPDVESLIVEGEKRKESGSERPIESIVSPNVLIVTEILRQCLELHQLVLHPAP